MNTDIIINLKLMEYNTTFTVLFDSDEELYYCKVGELKPYDSKGTCPLHYTVWGKTTSECRQRAKQLTTILHNQQSIYGVELV